MCFDTSHRTLADDLYGHYSTGVLAESKDKGTVSWDRIRTELGI